MAHSSSTHPGWLEITLQADPALHELLSSFFFDLGCTGLVLEDFQDRAIRAYLPFQKDLEEIRNRIQLYLQDLKEIFPDVESPDIRFGKLEDQDWGLNWRRFFRPARVTPGLLIIPAWEPVPESGSAHIIRMDPGPAFGTGQHPTTRMCLEAMERLPAIRPWTLLDVGTGSGILAVYGVKLGAKEILALDTDPEAIRWAEQNIRLNNAVHRIRLSQAPIEQMNGKFSLICANLILGEILRLIPFLSRLMDSGGRLILSGILENQVQDVDSALSRHGLEVHDTLHQGEWACVIAAKRP